MDAFLTGVTGLVGREVLRQLLERGDTVRALVRPASLDRFIEGFEPRWLDQVDLVVGDLSDFDVVADGVHGVEVVCHVAGQLPVPGTAEQQMVRINVKGTENCLRASVAGGVRRFVFTSSVMVYAHGTTRVTEEAPLGAVGPYGKTKVQAEELVRRYHKDAGLEYVILRPCPIYGPEVNESFFTRLVRQSVDQPWMLRLHDGDHIIQWVHVKDVATAVVLAATHARAANQAFNVAAGDVMTFKQLASMIRQVAGQPPLRAAMQFRQNPRPKATYVIEKAQRLLDYAPQVSLRDGMTELVAAFRQRAHSSKGAGPGKR